MIEYDVLDWTKGNEDVKTYYVHYVEGLEATVARRLELLKRLMDNVIWADATCGCEDCELVREVAEELADDDD